jgi:hypothetical protein
MVSIQIDEITATALQRHAQDAGLSVADYLRSLVPTSATPPRPIWDEIEAEIVAQSTAGPGLAADFSRADIYSDHD